MPVRKVPYNDTTAMGVYLLSPAPVGGAVYSLQIKAGQPAVVTFPPTVSIPQGVTDAQFDIVWAEAGTTIIQAQLTEYGGVPWPGIVFERDVEALDGPALLLVLPPAGVIVEGYVASMVVVLTDVVLNDTVVALHSSDISVGTVPPSVTVPTGQSTEVFDFTALSSGSTTVTASYLGVDKQSNIVVEPIEIAALSPSVVEAFSADTFPMRIIFEDSVIRDEAVTLVSSNTSVITVPSSVTVSSGEQVKLFYATGIRPGSAVITATHVTGSKQASLTVLDKPGRFISGVSGPKIMEAHPLISKMQPPEEI